MENANTPESASPPSPESEPVIDVDFELDASTTPPSPSTTERPKGASNLAVKQTLSWCSVLMGQIVLWAGAVVAVLWVWFTFVSPLRRTARECYEDGKSEWRMGNHGSAMRDFQRAAKLAPDFEEAWCFLGIAYTDRGRFDAALTALQKALKLNPHDSDAWYWLGEAEAKLENFSEAVKAYQEGIRDKPDDADLWYGLADAYCSWNRYNDAVVAYKECARLRPDDPDTWYSLGDTYALLGNFSGAKSALDRLRKLSPEEADILAEEIESFEATSSAMLSQSR